MGVAVWRGGRIGVGEGVAVGIGVSVAVDSGVSVGSGVNEGGSSRVGLVCGSCPPDSSPAPGDSPPPAGVWVGTPGMGSSVGPPGMASPLRWTILQGPLQVALGFQPLQRFVEGAPGHGPAGPGIQLTKNRDSPGPLLLPKDGHQNHLLEFAQGLGHLTVPITTTV